MSSKGPTMSNFFDKDVARGLKDVPRGDFPAFDT
jgi:hypothetical protein